MAAVSNTLAKLLMERENELLKSWISFQREAEEVSTELIPSEERRHESESFIRRLRQAVTETSDGGVRGPAWRPVRDFLDEMATRRAQRGFSASETAMFLLTFKQPLFEEIRAVYSTNSEALGDELWNASAILDQLGLYVTEVYIKRKEKVIQRQQEEMLELSTPVVQLWDNILALPIIGTLDTQRTQQIMETLLERIVETEAEIAIIDISGVPMVDTVTAQHLLKTIAAARLMGAQCIVSGIRPQIAQTMVELGVEFPDVMTKSSMEGALNLAFRQLCLQVQPMAS